MTRQEQKAVRELREAIKQSLKSAATHHGFKKISDCAYKVIDDFVYDIYPFAPPIKCGTEICVRVGVKPLVLDNIFWEVFQMEEISKKQSFSFHVTAAFVPYSHNILEQRFAIADSKETGTVLDEIFGLMDQCVLEHHRHCNTVSDFKAEILQKDTSISRMNVVLCEIAEGNFQEAAHLTKKVMEKDGSGIFNKIINGRTMGIYDYVLEFCEGK